MSNMSGKHARSSGCEENTNPVPARSPEQSPEGFAGHARQAGGSDTNPAGHHEHTHVHNHEHGESHGHNHNHDHAHDDSGHASGSGTVLTVRATSGLSGDMMLGGLAGLSNLTAGELNELVDELNLPALRGSLVVEPRSVNGIAGIGCRITFPHEHAQRSLADIRKIIENSGMPVQARELSAEAFAVLAEAEAAVHGGTKEEVHFHEVGALDSILDTCMVCRLFTVLEPARFVCSPLPMADGVISCAHGLVPSPAPAVLRMLEGVPVCGFSGRGETVTPTALSLLRALGAKFGPWPSMTVSRAVISYGTKVFPDAPNGSLWALGKTQGY